MPTTLFGASWFLQVVLASLALLLLGSVAAAICRQPVRRIRIIGLTLAGCLAAPALSAIPGLPRWAPPLPVNLAGPVADLLPTAQPAALASIESIVETSESALIRSERQPAISPPLQGGVGGVALQASQPSLGVAAFADETPVDLAGYALPALDQPTTIDFANQTNDLPGDRPLHLAALDEPSSTDPADPTQLAEPVVGELTATNNPDLSIADDRSPAYPRTAHDIRIDLADDATDTSTLMAAAPPTNPERLITTRPAFAMESQITPVWRRLGFGAWPARLAAIYLAGVTLLVLWGLIGLVALGRVLRAARPAPEACRAVLRAIGGRAADRVHILISLRTSQPFTFTWLRPVIVLPEALLVSGEDLGGRMEDRGWKVEDRGSTTEARLCESPWIDATILHRPSSILNPPSSTFDPPSLHWCLAHEWSHVARRDTWLWTFSSFVRLVFWFQPLVWWLRRELRLSQDYLADAAAAEGAPPEAYAEFLATRALGGTLALGLGISAGKSDLYRRVAMLVTTDRTLERRCPRGWTAGLAGCGVAVVLLAATFGVRSETHAGNESQAPPLVDNAAAGVALEAGPSEDIAPIRAKSDAPPALAAREDDMPTAEVRALLQPTADSVRALAAGDDEKPAAELSIKFEDASPEQKQKMLLFSGMVRQAQAIRSGRIEYSRQTSDQPSDEYRVSQIFSGESWAAHSTRAHSTLNVGAPRGIIMHIVNHGGRRMMMLESGNDKSIHRSLKIDWAGGPPNSIPWATLAEKSARYAAGNGATWLGQENIRGIATHVLECPLNGRAVVDLFGGPLEPHRAQGAIRINVAPAFGYAVVRIKQLDRFGLPLSVHEFSEIKDVEPGIFVPYQVDARTANSSTSSRLVSIGDINQPIPDREFEAAIKIPVGTEITDQRAHRGDTVGKGGKPEFDRKRYPLREFKTWVDELDGLPPKVLEEMDRDVLTREEWERMKGGPRPQPDDLETERQEAGGREKESGGRSQVSAGGDKQAAAKEAPPRNPAPGRANDSATASSPGSASQNWGRILYELQRRQYGAAATIARQLVRDYPDSEEAGWAQALLPRLQAEKPESPAPSRKPPTAEDSEKPGPAAGGGEKPPAAKAASTAVTGRPVQAQNWTTSAAGTSRSKPSAPSAARDGELAQLKLDRAVFHLTRGEKDSAAALANDLLRDYPTAPEAELARKLLADLGPDYLWRDDLGRANSQSTPAATKGAGEADKPAARPKNPDLLYAGKNWNEWRSALLNELEPASRVKALIAIGAFARNGYAPEAADTIAQLLNGDNGLDNNVYSTACIALGNCGEPALSILAKQLGVESENAEVRRSQVAIALGKIAQQSERAIPILVRAAGNDVDAVRKLAYHALAASPFSGQKEFAVVERAFARDDESGQGQVLAGLEKNRQADAALWAPLVQKGLAADAWGTRYQAALLLAQRGPATPDIVENITRSLMDTDINARGNFLMRLRERQHKGEPIEPAVAVPVVIALLESPAGINDSEGTAIWALQFLGHVPLDGPGKAGLPVLLKGAQGQLAVDTAKLRIAAIDELGNAGPAAKEVLPDLIRLQSDAGNLPKAFGTQLPVDKWRSRIEATILRIKGASGAASDLVPVNLP